MNKEQAKENAAVMLAFAEGMTIECRARVGYGKWCVTKTPTFAFDYNEYRVKPEPLEVFVTYYEIGGDGKTPTCGGAYFSEDRAKIMMSRGGVVKKFREVIEK